MSTKTPDLPFSEFVSLLPAADLADLAGLSASAVRERTLAKAEEHRRFALALLSIHNAVSPVHRLPFELLSAIFRAAWKDRSSLRMTHVCRRWRSTALQTPELWADATACESFSLAGPDHPLLEYSYMDSLLERSAPHDVCMTIIHFPEALRFHLLPRISRIAVLEIKVHSAKQLHNLWETLHGGVPSLEELYILCPVANYLDMYPHPDERTLETIHSLLSAVSQVKLSLHCRFNMQCYTQDGSTHTPLERFRAESVGHSPPVDTFVVPLFRPAAPMLWTNITHLVLDIDRWYSTKSALLEPFPHLVRVEINIEGDPGETLSLLQRPGGSNSDGTGSSALVCPSLRELITWVEVPTGTLRTLLEPRNLGDLEEYVT
ncbi:hypothetical protein BD310DRAFT_953194 [Dichomitus squalens]|uniref:F-box domain-containing protein n=1 Tax=Dichomitus squalens TaxID=114155 RepID=A0A4Q9PAU7_9APHY|nr:hypothetical protein BD310DRAFT_953194 [Dichomitus squalens]